ncbi:hypothetical protein [Ligilactobacillus salivarius]|uniref:Putative membrane spanning protein n=1 Tax=Ligilactobacillus salivarius TaxID=1624 RepID=A0A089QHB7_9LACO|nr:hypothetical protein [Ligilactobacillus salivarius]AIR11248.1 putative membrane spanning protein [Ligilactobacillus salivarius]
MDILTTAIEKIKNNPNRDKVGKYIFYTAFIIYLVTHFLMGTMYVYIFYDIGLSIPYRIMMVAVALAIIKILFFNRISNWQELTIEILVGLLLAVTAINSQTMDLLYYYIMILAAKDLDFKQILKVFIYIEVFMLLFSAFSVYMGWILEVVNMRTGNTGIRLSLGSVYPTDLAARIFYISLAYVTLKKFKLSLPEYISLLAIGTFIYFVTDTKVDALLVLLLIIVSASYNAVTRILYKVGVNTITLIAGVIIGIEILLTYLYTANSRILNIINSALSGRLNYGHTAFKKYNVTMFGQFIKERANGGIHKEKFNYFFIDVSYLRVLMFGGVVAFVALVIMLIYLANKFMNDKTICLLVALLFAALSSLIDQHLMELSYNIIFIAMLTNNDYFKDKLV